MGLARKLIVYRDRIAGTKHHASGPRRLYPSNRHLGIELAGAFVFAGTIAALGPGLHGTNASAVTDKSSDAGALSSLLNLQLSHDISAPDTAGAVADNSGNSTNSAQASSSASSNSDGSVSTEASINGEAVDVPANGSVTKTVTTPDGQTITTSITNSQSSSGNIHGSSFTHTSMHVSSNADVNDQEGE